MGLHLRIFSTYIPFSTYGNIFFVTIASASVVSVLSVHMREQPKISLRRMLTWSAIEPRIPQGQGNTSRTRGNVKFSMMVPSRVKVIST